MDRAKLARVTGAVNYGIDAPQVVRRLLLLGAAGLALGALSPLFPPGPAGIARALAISAAFLLATALVMLWGSKVGKLRLRDRMLARIPWIGNEQVLDVGCGHGLMLIGAAKLLVHGGRAHGIDLWSNADHADNSAAATLRNAQLEGVAERIEIHSGDARALPFADASFEVVLSSFALHNIPGERERARALREIARVLKPGGQLAIADIRHSRRYAQVLADCGLLSVHRSLPSFLFVTPTRVVSARKPI